MRFFEPLLKPKEFVKLELEAENPSFLKSFAALAIASLFVSFTSTFAVYPLFQQTLFAGSLIPFDLAGFMLNAFLIFSFFLLFELAEFFILRAAFDSKARLADHSYFSSTLVLPLVPFAAALSVFGLLAGFILRFLSEPSSALLFIESSWPLYSCYSMAHALFPSLAFSVKVPGWAFEASQAYDSAVFLTLLLAPIAATVFSALAHVKSIAAVHGIDEKKCFAGFAAAALLVLIACFALFRVSYYLLVIS